MESFCSSSCRTPRTCSRLTRRDSELGDTSSESLTYSDLGVQETAGVGKRMEKDEKETESKNQTDVLTALSETCPSDPESRLS